MGTLLSRWAVWLVLALSWQACGKEESCPVDPDGLCGNGVLDPGELCDEGLEPYGVWREGVNCATVTNNPQVGGQLRCHCCTPYTERCRDLATDRSATAGQLWPESQSP